MLKVTVIGGGSTYTPELVAGFLERTKELPIRELWLMDIDPERLEIVGGFARRMVTAHGSPFEVILTDNRRDAIAASDYIITQLRVGKMQARRSDEYLGQRYNLIGQETTGVGGMAKALRTIPVILDIAREIKQLAPDAWLLNFTNPSGLISEALSRHAPGLHFAGVCNSAITTKMGILAELEEARGEKIDPQRLEIDTLGLNHLTWYRGARVDDEEVWPLLLDAFVDRLRHSPDPEWDPDTVATLGMIPNSYLRYYYYTQKMLARQQKWPPSRAEQVMQIEADLLKQYTDPELTSPPPELMRRGGAYYSTLATRLIDSLHNDLGQIHVANVCVEGAVPGWPARWVVEIPCRVGRHGIQPLPAEPLPEACAGLVAEVKAYELHTVEAAVHGNRREAYMALLAHPLGPSADMISTVLDDMLTTNRGYLPQFFK